MNELQGRKPRLLLQMGVAQHSMQRVPLVKRACNQRYVQCVQAPPHKNWAPLSGHTSFVSLPQSGLSITNQSQ